MSYLVILFVGHRTDTDLAHSLGVWHKGPKNRPGRSMHEVNDAQWLAFEALAKTYPNDNGVRLTADLARWLVEEYQRQKLPVAPIVQRVVHSVTQELQSFSSRAAGPNQLATK